MARRMLKDRKPEINKTVPINVENLCMYLHGIKMCMCVCVCVRERERERERKRDSPFQFMYLQNLNLFKPS